MEKLKYIIVAATAALSLVGCEKTVQPKPQEGELRKIVYFCYSEKLIWI